MLARGITVDPTRGYLIYVLMRNILQTAQEFVAEKLVFANWMDAKEVVALTAQRRLRRYLRLSKG